MLCIARHVAGETLATYKESIEGLAPLVPSLPMLEIILQTSLLRYTYLTLISAWFSL